jgi:arsenate reductase
MPISLSAKLKQVLVVCTANSCRSGMAEVLINTLGGGRCLAKSAGSHPAGYVNPKVLETLGRHHIDPGTPQSQSWDEYAKERVDLLITVCNSAAAEHCPAFPGEFVRLHWSTPDPAQTIGSEEEIDAAFERAFALLKTGMQKELL